MGKTINAALLSAFSLLLAALVMHCSGRALHEAPDSSRLFVFHEVWGYLMKGEEKEVTGREPFTDLLYFGVTMNEAGGIIGSAKRPDIHFAGASPRMHLVVYKLSDPSFLHFSMKKGQAVRGHLIDNIVACAREFEGIQVDFEALRPDDGLSFLEFIGDLKKRMPDKIVSVAVPARVMKTANDAYDYSALSGSADRVVVMAYDQHWKNSSPGPVASLSWCDSVAGYATDTIPPDKLVMGLPLYGRAWPAVDLGRSLKYRQIMEELMRSQTKREVWNGKEPYLEYTQSVKVRVFYEDMNSIHAKLRLYKSYGIKGVAFWRIGQGPEELWETLFIGSR